MAIQNNPYLYSGGSERFNYQPHVNLYAQLAAKKQARDDAFDEYIRNLNKNINPAGLRNQERPVFDERLADWQGFVMNNRDAIRKRTNGADIVAQQKYQDIVNTIAESKKAEEEKKPGVEILLDPAKRDRVDEEGVMKSFHAHDQPIWSKDEKGQWQRNRERVPINYTEFSFNPKEFTADDWRKYEEGLSKSIPADKSNISLKAHPDDKYSQIETTETAYSPQKLKSIGDVAKNDFLGNRPMAYSFSKTHPFEKWVTTHEKEFGELNKAFKTAYGNDSNIQDEGDLFAATQIQKRLAPTLAEKRIDNWKARDDQNFAQQKELLSLKNSYDRGMAEFREKLKTVGEEKGNLWIDEHIDGLVNDAKKGSTVQIFEIGGKKYTEKQLPNDPVLRNSFKNGNTIPDYITVTSEGKLRPVFLKTDQKSPNGGYKFDAIISQPVELESAKLGLGKTSGVKHLNEEMSGGGGGKPASTTKTTTFKFKSSYKTPKGDKTLQELKKHYTDEQIQNYINRGALK